MQPQNMAVSWLEQDFRCQRRRLFKLYLSALSFSSNVLCSNKIRMPAVLKQTPVKRYLGFPINNPKPGSNPTLTAVQPLGHAAGGRPIQTFATRPPLQSKDKRKNR